jgi:hypothetical protein
MHMAINAKNVNGWISYKILCSILCTISTSTDPDFVKVFRYNLNVSHLRYVRMRLRLTKWADR